MRDRRLRQRDLEDDDERDEEEDQQPEIGNDDDQPAGKAWHAAASASGLRSGTDRSGAGRALVRCDRRTWHRLRSYSRQHDAGVRQRRRSRPVVPGQRIVRRGAAALSALALTILAVVELDVVDRHVAEIGDVPDLALGGVERRVVGPACDDTRIFSGRTANARPCCRLSSVAGIVGARCVRPSADDRCAVPIVAARHLAFEHVDLADEVGDEARVRRLVDLGRRRRPARSRPCP